MSQVDWEETAASTVPSQVSIVQVDRQESSSDFVFQSLGTFEANFALAAVPGYKPTPAEQAYLERLNACVAGFAAIPLPEPEKNPDIRELKEDVRNRAVKALRDGAEQFARAPSGDRNKKAITERDETYRIEGRYNEWNARIDTIPFDVKPMSVANDLYNDLKINTRDVHIPEDKARLKVEIDTALTVAKLVFGEREKSIGWWRARLPWYASQVDAVQMRLHDSITQLLGIAKVGLMNVDPTQAAFARNDLARFKSEFVAREAGTVKNRYLWRLGRYCLLATLLMVLGYIYARYYAVGGSIWHDFRNFFLLAIGTAIGTWLSFSLRRPTLTFDDLVVLEEDRLDPSVRVLFMIGLTAVVGLLFWTHAVSFGVGDLESKLALQAHGAEALLIGLLAGIAERALGTAVSRRAADFAASLGGTAGSAAGGGTVGGGAAKLSS